MTHLCDMLGFWLTQRVAVLSIEGADVDASQQDGVVVVQALQVRLPVTKVM